MLVNRKNYDPRSLVNRTNPKGVENLGIVVRCPTLVGNRLVYFDYNHVGQGWVIRDFITGWKLDNEHSSLSVDNIEADVDYRPPIYLLTT